MGDVPTQETSAETWVNKGDEFLQLKKYEEALDCYLNATDINPEYAPAWHKMGLICQILGQKEEADICFEKERIAIQKSNIKRIRDTEFLEKKEEPLSSSPIVQASSQTITSTSKQNYCPACGSELQFKEAEICPKCGVRIQGPPQVKGEKSLGIATLLSAILPGLGQVYNGDFTRGLLFLIGTFVGLLFFIIPGVIVWVYQIYDAYSTAKKMNAGQIPFKETNTGHIILWV